MGIAQLNFIRGASANNLLGSLNGSALTAPPTTASTTTLSSASDAINLSPSNDASIAKSVSTGAVTPSRLPKPSPNARVVARHQDAAGLPPSRIPLPPSSTKRRPVGLTGSIGNVNITTPVLSSSLKRKPKIEVTSDELFQRNLASALQAENTAFVGSARVENKTSERRSNSSGWSPVKKMAPTADEEHFVVTKKISAK